MPTIHLDGATWRKLLISYTQLASYLTRISLAPTSPAVFPALQSSRLLTVPHVRGWVARRGGVEAGPMQHPPALGTDLKCHCDGSIKTGSLFRVYGIRMPLECARAFIRLKNVKLLEDEAKNISWVSFPFATFPPCKFLP